MFEAQLAYYLNRYLGAYVKGLDAQSLKISVFAGDVVLKNLQLKPEALNEFNLPITVKAGLLGSLTLKVPWANLGRAPVIVEMDRLYVLAAPNVEFGSSRLDQEADLEAIQQAAKRRRAEETEQAWVHDRDKREQAGAPEAGKGGGLWMRALIDTIIGNLQLSISNVHVRYEDDVSYPGCPLACGFTLEKLTAHTVDELGKKAFISQNPMAILRKASELQRFSLYFDVGAKLWRPPKPWAQLSLDDWDSLFLPGLSVLMPTPDGGTAEWPEPEDRTYILKPVDGALTYIRRGREARSSEAEAIQEFDVKFNAISLHASQAQYRSVHKLLSEFSAYAARAAFSHLRPPTPPRDSRSARLWWQYAIAVVKSKLIRTSGWTQIQQVCSIRRKYVPLYIRCLQENQLGGNEEIKQYDEKLDEATIVFFRRLAHTQVQRDKRKAAAASAQAKQAAGGTGWLGWLTGAGKKDANAEHDPALVAETDKDMRSGLNDEEYAALMQLVTEQEDAIKSDDSETPMNVRMRVDLAVGNSSIVLDNSSVEVMRGALEGLKSSLLMYPEAMALELAVQAVRVVSPEGTFLHTGDELRRLSQSAGEGKEGEGEAQAMQLKYVHKPQDGSADAQAWVALSPSYITYNPATIARVTDYFKTEEVADLTALGAQAAAQVERARQAAKVQLQAALQRRPKMVLHLDFDAPKVAVPVPACQATGEGKLTLVVDFGRFLLESDPEFAAGLPPQEAALYECFRLTGRDAAAYLVDGSFSWQAVMEAITSPAAPKSGALVPILERCAVEAVMQAGRLQHPSLPPLRLGLNVPRLRFFFSPARLHRIMRVIHTAVPESEEFKPSALPGLAEGADQMGEVRVLAWGGLGRTMARWPRRWAVLQRGSLLTAPSQDAVDNVVSYSLWQNKRVMQLAPEAVGGVHHVVAIARDDVEPSKVVEDHSSLLLRLSTAQEAETWLKAIQRAQQHMQQLAAGGRDYNMDDVDDAGSVSVASQHPSTPAAVTSPPLIEITAGLGDFAVFVSGRVTKNWWPPQDYKDESQLPTEDAANSVVSVDGEHALVVVHASGAETELAYGEEQMSISLGIDTFEIEDLLVGPVCPSHRFLARSYEGTAQGEDEEFYDATSDLGPAMQRSLSMSSRSSSRSLSRNGSRPGLGAIRVDSAQYVDAPETTDDSPAGTRHGRAWQMNFDLWRPQSPLYTGIDSELRMKLTSFWFFCNRPTIGALIQIGTDVSDALETGEQPTMPAPEAAEDPESDDESEAGAAELLRSEESGRLVLGGGQERTVFRLIIEMEKLEAVFFYEAPNAAPLASLSVTDLRFLLNIHPATLHLTSSLGNVLGIDGTLPEDNPYRKIIEPRKGTSTSLIEVEIASHTAEEADVNDRVPAGMEFWSVKAQLTQLDLIFLNRFLQEVLTYIFVTLAMAPAKSGAKAAPGKAGQRRLDRSVSKHTTKRSSLEQPQSSVRRASTDSIVARQQQEQQEQSPTSMVVLLDVDLDAPIITLPRHSDSKDQVEADLGSLHLANVVRWVGGSDADDPAAVLLDTATISMTGLSAVVVTEGQAGNNMIHEYDEGMEIVLTRALRDPHQVLPAMAVAVNLPSIKATISDKEFQLITSVAGANFSEAMRVPSAALWLQERHLPDSLGNSSSDELEADAQLTSPSAGFKPGRLLPTITASSEEEPLSPDDLPPGFAEPPVPSKPNIKAVVNIGRAELEMLRTMQDTHTIEPLARFQVSDLWVSYLNTVDGAMFVTLSVPHVLCIDARPWVSEEHSVVISAGLFSSPGSASTPSQNGLVPQPSPEQHLTPSFLTLQYVASARMLHQKLQVRLQRPTVVGEMGFILAVTKFAVPSFALSGVNPLPYRSDDLRLQEPTYHAEADLFLSPESRLLADAHGISDFIYDGHGHRIVLPEGIDADEQLALIVVGAGKTLQLKNVIVAYSASLPACIKLDAGAQLVAHPGDNVTRLEGSDPTLSRTSRGASAAPSRSFTPAGSWERVYSRSTAVGASARPSSPRNALSVAANKAIAEVVAAEKSVFEMEVAALDMSLHFLELEQGDAELRALQAGAEVPSGGQQGEGSSVRALAAHLDLAASYRQAGSQQSGQAELQGLRLESFVNLSEASQSGQQEVTSGGGGRSSAMHAQSRVLEPCNVTARLDVDGGAGDLHIDITTLRLNVSGDVLELLLSLQSSVLEPLVQPSPERPLARCTQFTKVWADGEVSGGNVVQSVLGSRMVGTRQGITFWRPQPPIGYGILGDCAAATIATNNQPTFQVLSVAVNSGLVAYPVGYTQVWANGGLGLWRPVPPEHYCALGCITHQGSGQPALTAVLCAHENVCVEAPAGACLQLRPHQMAGGPRQSVSEPIDLWCIDNFAATFVSVPAGTGRPQEVLLDLRSPLGVAPAALSTGRPAAARAPPLSLAPPDDSGTPAQHQRDQAHRYRKYCRERKVLQRSASRKRLRSSAVDFQRIWWDQDVKAASLEGVGIWRPVPPPGYASLGDCICKGFDPPLETVVLQNHATGDDGSDGDEDAIALLKPPRGYELVWHDESVRAEKALSIWRPVPFPGFVALGFVASIGPKIPSRMVMRCVRADAVREAEGLKRQSTWKLPPLRSRRLLAVWLSDERLGTFVACADGAVPRVEEMLQLKMLHRLDESTSSVSPSKSGMNLVVKAEGARLILRDILRRPLAEVSLGDTEAVVRRLSPDVMQAYCGVRTAVWFYNAAISSWEPVIEPWDLILKVDANQSSTAAFGVDPGTSITLKSTSESVHITLAYSAINSVLDAYLDWQSMRAGGRSEEYRRQLAAADSAAVFTIIDNRLGAPVSLEADFGDHVEVLEVAAGEAKPTMQPVKQDPLRHTSLPSISPQALPPALLLVDVISATPLRPVGALQLYASLQLQSLSSEDWGLRTRAVPGGSGRAASWRERLITRLPASGRLLSLEAALWKDDTASGAGMKLAQGVLTLPAGIWHNPQPHAHTIRMADPAGNQAWEVEVRCAVQAERYQVVREPTDAWNAEKSSVGQVALKVADSRWSLITGGGRQRTLGAAAAAQASAQGSEATSASVLPVRVDDSGIAIQRSFQDGVKCEVLRSLCQLVNQSELPLQVCLAETDDDWQVLPSTSGRRSDQVSRRSSSSSSSSAGGEVVEEEVFENERFIPIKGWSSKGSLFPGDRKRFSRSRNGSGQSFNEFPSITLPDGWEWEGPWRVEASGYVDRDGWAYFPDFGSMRYPPPPGARSKAVMDFVRRRRWVRRRRRASFSAAASPFSAAASGSLQTAASIHSLQQASKQQAEAARSRVMLGTVAPGAAVSLPYGWRAPGKQLQVRPVLGQHGGDSHVWSIGGSGGAHSLLLDTVAEGLTRLVACPPLDDAQLAGQGKDKGALVADKAGLTEKLQASALWLSLTVDGDTLLGGKDDPDALTDWRIVAAAPMVLENHLPVSGSFLVWERPQAGKPLVLRQSGQIESGRRVHIYTADMRREVRLQFYPDGYEYADAEPVLLSRGYSSHQAGVEAADTLPSKFGVYRDACHQDIYLDREICNDWLLEDNGAKVDPGMAVAMGGSLVVRVMVPLWVVNASTLPISAAVVPASPPPKASPDASQHLGHHRRSVLVDVADTFGEQIMDTYSKTASTSFRERDALSRQELSANSVDILSYPLPKPGAKEQKQWYGVRLRVESSGWTAPLLLEGGEAGGMEGAEAGANTKPALIRARVVESGALYEVVARLEMVGGIFSRTMVLLLEPHFVVTNRTGLALQLVQPRGSASLLPATASARKRDRLMQHLSLVQQGEGSGKGGSRGKLSSEGSYVPLERSDQGMTALHSGITPATVVDLDWNTTQELAPGMVNFPVHWSLLAEQRAVCLRAAAGRDRDHLWSQPIEAALGDGTMHHIAVPIRTVSSVQATADSKLQLHGPRVHRRLTHPAGEELMEVVVLRYYLESSSPGCLVLVLQSLSDKPPYLLENRSGHSLLYRQVTAPLLPYLTLPAYSAAGYVWQFSAKPRRMEVKEEVEGKAAAVQYELDPPERGISSGEDVAQGGAPEAGVPQLPLSVEPGECQVEVVDREAEAIVEAGLRGLGAAGGIGRRGLERALRITPGRKQQWAPRPLPGVKDKGAQSLSLAVLIGLADISLVDNRPQELLLVTVAGFKLDYATGIGPEGTFASFRLAVQNMQLDDQLPHTRFPVVLAALDGGGGEGVGAAAEQQPLVCLTLVSQPGLPRRQVYYPFISFRVSRTLQLSVSETLVWRAVEVVRRLDLGRAAAQGGGGATQAAADVPIQVSLVSLADLAANVSFRGDLASRPRWAGRTISWGLDLADFEAVPVKLTGLEMEHATMLWSAFMREVMNTVQRQLVSVAIGFVRNFGFFSGTSGMLGLLSAGVASVAMDRRFAEQRLRLRQERSISGVGEGLAEGGEALGMGFLRGVTGLVSKPLEGAKRKGVEGFVTGIGKGLVGAVAQPVSGGLDLMSSAIEGLDASKDKLMGKPRSGITVRRRRLPRVLGGDHKLQPFVRNRGESQARVEEVGQALLWRTERDENSLLPMLRSRARPADWRRDCYEEHFLLPDDRVALLTDRSLLLVVAPGFAALHAAAESGAGVTDTREVPQAVLRWAVAWEDLLALELRYSARELPFPDRLTVHRRGRPGVEEEEPLAEEVRCFPNTPQVPLPAFLFLRPLLLCCCPKGSIRRATPLRSAELAAQEGEAEPLAHELSCFAGTTQAQELKAVAMKILNKYITGPQRERTSWQLRHDHATPEHLQGVEGQQMPLSVLSMDYKLVWHTAQHDNTPPVTIWRPVCPAGYKPLGHVISLGFEPPAEPVQTYCEHWGEEVQHQGEPPAAQERPPMVHPQEYHLIWRDNGRTPVTMWEPIPPLGYRAVGTVVVGGVAQPEVEEVLVVREDLLAPTRLFDSPLWSHDPPLMQQGLKLQRLRPYYPETWRCSLWQVDNSAGTFIAVRSLGRPSGDAALALK